MVNKRYYEKLGGFDYVLDELRKRIGSEQTDILINDAVKLCNELSRKYKNLPKKEKFHTDRAMIMFTETCPASLSSGRARSDEAMTDVISMCTGNS